MEKVYGYKAKTVKDFAEFLKKRDNQSLTEVFSEYAAISGKAKGTIRNMYYAMAKKGRDNEKFRKEIFSGVNPNVKKPEKFEKDELEVLIHSVLEAKKRGLSVRSAINELAKGDIKLALRYQNKYRNAVKSGKVGRADVYKITRLKSETDAVKNVKNVVSESVLNKLKTEINSLVGRIAEKTARENAYYKERISVLELENARLNNLLYGNKSNESIRFFRGSRKKDVIS